MSSSLDFKKRLALKLYKRYRENQIKIHKLSYIFWECTLRCNQNCRHCGSDCQKDASVKDMPANDFLKAIDQLEETVIPNETMIVFTGGEALLRKDLEFVGQQLYNRGFPWGIVTNGYALNQKRLLSLLNSGLRAVTVSLDGFEKPHNWLRGNPNSFKKAVESIELLSRTENLIFDVVTCVHPQNFESLTSFKDFLIEKGVKKWRIFTIFPIGRAQNDEELKFDDIKFYQLFEFIKQTRLEGKIDLNYGCEGFLGNYEKEVRDSFFFCKSGINVASILVDGSITGCPNLRDNFIQGNIYKDNIADVWENRFSKFRDRSWTQIGICEGCENHKYCNGNGMHLWDGESGQLALCHLKKIEQGAQKCMK